MDITGVNASATTSVSGNGTMDLQDFLKIMSAQLQNMDPMGESSDGGSDYISQMAQFTMLDQMTELSERMESISLLSQQQLAFSMVGKSVTVDDGEQAVSGIVEKVIYSNGYAYPVIDGREYAMNMITEIREE